MNNVLHWLRRYIYLDFYFYCFYFFFNDTATTEIYTLSLHDALPISSHAPVFETMWRLESEPAATEFIVARQSRNARSEEHTSELQSQSNLVCRLLLEKKKETKINTFFIQAVTNNTINLQSYSYSVRL